MIDQVLSFLGALADQTGLAHLWWGNLVMIAIGCAMIYLAIVKHYEPLLLVGIGFSCIISNVPGSDLTQPGGLFHYAYQGVQLLDRAAADLLRRRRDDRFRADDRQSRSWSFSARRRIWASSSP